MSFEETLNVSRALLLVCTNGVMDEVADSMLCTLKPLSSILFKPFQSYSDGFFRASTVFTAPIAYTILSIDHLLQSLFYAIKGLYLLAFSDREDADKSFVLAKETLFTTAVLTCCIIPSIFFNLADLGGAGINLIREISSPATVSP